MLAQSYQVRLLLLIKEHVRSPFEARSEPVPIIFFKYRVMSSNSYHSLR